MNIFESRLMVEGEWLEVREEAGYALVNRTPRPFGSLAEAASAYLTVAQRLEPFGSRGLALIVDLRQAPSRNDPGFEQVIAPHRRRMFAAFSRSAIVVKSATGLLQVKRLAAADGADTGVFTDLPSAVEYVTRASKGRAGGTVKGER